MAIIDVTTAPYNASGDGINDDTSALAAAITGANAGDWIYFPDGVYRCTSGIDIHKRDITFYGDGWVTAIVDNTSDYAANSGGTIISVDHTGAQFIFHEDSRNFHARDFSIKSQDGSQDAGTAGFKWDATGSFTRGFTFERINQSDIENAWIIDGGGTMGVINIKDCHARQCHWVFNCESSSRVNIFHMDGCDFGNNDWSDNDFRVNLLGTNMTIEDTNLEGQYQPLQVENTSSNFILRKCYFESNYGGSAIKLLNVDGFAIEDNLYSNMTSTSDITASYSINGKVDQTPRLFGCIDVAIRTQNVADDNMHQTAEWSLCGRATDLKKPHFNWNYRTCDVISWTDDGNPQTLTSGVYDVPAGVDYFACLVIMKQTDGSAVENGAEIDVTMSGTSYNVTYGTAGSSGFNKRFRVGERYYFVLAEETPTLGGPLTVQITPSNGAGQQFQVDTVAFAVIDSLNDACHWLSNSHP